jgi:integrase
MTEPSIQTDPSTPTRGRRPPKRHGGYSVFTPDRDRLANRGFGEVAHVAVLFDADLRYLRVPNRYLRERAKLEWHPSSGRPGQRRVGDFPSERTLRDIAYALSNFLQWCEACRSRRPHVRGRPVDWQTATYDDVLVYQAAMRSGAWSSRGRPLSPETANLRADVVTAFLAWAARRGLRGQFETKVASVRRHFDTGTSAGTGWVILHARAGRERKGESRALSRALAIPREHEVLPWLTAVRDRRGYAKFLACRMILEVGPRLFEVTGLTVDQWPSADMLDYVSRQGSDYAVVRLLKTKGGRPRDTMVPLPFAREVRAWIDGPRLRLAHRHYKRVRSTPTELFISDARGQEGTPIARHTIYDCFREVVPRPRFWSPHLGRHFFACLYVLRALHAEARAVGRTVDSMGADWVSSRGAWHLALLRRQLGHISEETTQIYLAWLVTATQVADVAAGWHSFLDASVMEDVR